MRIPQRGLLIPHGKRHGALDQHGLAARARFVLCPPTMRTNGRSFLLALPLLFLACGSDRPPAPAATGQAHAAEAQRPRRAPPPAAYDACTDKKAGDACEVAFGARKLTGACVARDEGKLVCRPEGRGGRRGPRPEALEACTGKKADDACEVTFGERTLNGTCRATEDGKLACRPQRPPRSL